MAATLDQLASRAAMDRVPFSTTPDDTSGDGGASARGGARDSLLLTATLLIAGRETNVRVRNLSAGGLMAEYPGVVSLGEPVSIEMRGIGRVEGRVAWATDGRIGIAFGSPIDPLAARKPVGRARAADDDGGWRHVYPAATPLRPKR